MNNGNIRAMSGLSFKNLLGYTLLSIISGLTGFLFITVVNKIINEIILNQAVSQNTFYSASFVMLIVVYFGTRRWLSVKIIKISQELFWQSRMDIVRLLLKAPYIKIMANKNKIYSTLTQDVHNIVQASLMIIEFVTSLVLILSCLAYMAYISLSLFVISLGVIVLGVSVYHFSSSKNNRRFSVSRDLEDDFMLLFNSILQGVKELNLDQKKSKAISQGRLLTVSRLALKNDQKAFVSLLDNQFIGQLFFYLLIGFILLYAGSLTGASLDVSVNFVFIILYILGPIGIVASWVPVMSKARISILKVAELKKELTEIAKEKSKGKTYYPINFESLRYKGYSFSYGQDKFNIGPINLTLNKGDTIFIYGGNGSGKTTFINTLLHIFNPEKGEVFLNKNRVAQSELDNLKTLFAVVFSDFYLFDSFYGYSDFDQAKAKYYLEIFEIDKKVELTKNGFSTIDLSTGQKKRLALIAALLENKPLLVLDEWAADQDPLFRKKFYTKIIPIIRNEGKTILAITHDDKYYYCADLLLKMDYGKLTKVN